MRKKIKSVLKSQRELDEKHYQFIEWLETSNLRVEHAIGKTTPRKIPVICNTIPAKN